MRKTTIYLPDHLLEGVKAAAAVRHCSEAHVIRSALERELAGSFTDGGVDFGMLSREFGPLGLDVTALDESLAGFGTT